MSDVTTRTVTFSVDPALAAYVAWLDATSRTFDLHDYELFAAGYRSQHPPTCGDRSGVSGSACVLPEGHPNYHGSADGIAWGDLGPERHTFSGASQ